MVVPTPVVSETQKKLVGRIGLNVSILSRNPENDENRSRVLINALIISNIYKRDHLTRRIHYKLIGCKRLTPKKISFCFILYSPFYCKDFNRYSSFSDDVTQALGT